MMRVMYICIYTLYIYVCVYVGKISLQGQILNHQDQGMALPIREPSHSLHRKKLIREGIYSTCSQWVDGLEKEISLSLLLNV